MTIGVEFATKNIIIQNKPDDASSLLRGSEVLMNQSDPNP